jgi:hypothetical protein
MPIDLLDSRTSLILIARALSIRMTADRGAATRYASAMRAMKAISCVFSVVFLLSALAPSQQKAGADALQLRAPSSRNPIQLTAADVKSLPHITVKIHNSHTDADETYAGVRLADLFSKPNMDAPLGNELRGKALSGYIIATGSDGYRAVLALAEIDPSFHPGEVLVADAMNGRPLDAHSGPFKLIVTEDKRPARSVRNLVSLELKMAE